MTTIHEGPELFDDSSARIWQEYVSLYRDISPATITDDDVEEYVASGDQEKKERLVKGAIRKIQLEVSVDELSEIAWKRFGLASTPEAYLNHIGEEDFNPSFFIDRRGRILITGMSHYSICEIYGIPEHFWYFGIMGQFAADDFQRRTGAIQGAIHGLGGQRIYVMVSQQPITDNQIDTMIRLFSQQEGVHIGFEGEDGGEDIVLDVFPQKEELCRIFSKSNIRPQAEKNDQTESLVTFAKFVKDTRFVGRRKNTQLMRDRWLDAYNRALIGGKSETEAIRLATSLLTVMQRFRYFFEGD